MTKRYIYVGIAVLAVVGVAFLLGWGTSPRWPGLAAITLDANTQTLRDLSGNPVYGIAMPSISGQPDALLGYLGSIVVINPALPPTDPGYIELIGDYRPHPDQLKVVPVSEILYEGRVTAAVAADGKFTTFAAQLKADEAAEIVVRNDLIVRHSDPSTIPYDRLREMPLRPDRQYFFIDSLVVTSITRRNFRQIQAAGDAAGTAFLANGKIYASNERFETSRQVWIPPFNLRRLRSSEGGEADELGRLLRERQRTPQTDARMLDLIRERSVREAPTEMPLSLPAPPGTRAGPSVTDSRTGAAIDFRVEGVPQLKQRSDNACWATAAAMLVGWREKRHLQPDEFLRELTPRWVAVYQVDAGLPAEDKAAFLADSGLGFEWGASYLPTAVHDMLRSYGPLWFTMGTSNSFGTHAIVVNGIREIGGDVWVSFIDPRDGMEHDLPYGDFHRMYDEGGYLYNELFSSGSNEVYTIHVVHCGQVSPSHESFLNRRRVPND